MASSHLRQLLQSLCSNSEWNYAVFWKLKHHAQMVLTWEDAYYNNNLKHDALEGKSSSEALASLHDGHFALDPLGLAVANMSYHVYSLGEGIVGQVAVLEKHRWIFSSDYTTDPHLSPEISDGWKAQFSAGVKTIVVAPVVPHGVVQLGSLNEVKEDFKKVIHIRDLFSSLQDSSACPVKSSIECSVQNELLMSDLSARTLNPDVRTEYVLDVDRALTKDTCVSSPVILSHPKQGNDSYGSSLSDFHLNEKRILKERNRLPDMIENVELIQTVSGVHQSTDLLNDTSYRINSCGIQNADLLAKLKSETNADVLPGFNCLEALDELRSSFMFSAGSELHEALGPVFVSKSFHLSWEADKLEGSSAFYMPEVTERSLLTSDSGSDHLLEAVVANFCRKDVGHKSAVSFSTSESMLRTEKMPEPSTNTSPKIGSSSYSIGYSSPLEGNMKNCLNSSDSCSIRPSTSGCRDTYLRPSEPGKTSKKRARPGENPRPRPRDRQLIQDRFKELRELVPNGSKCSIDSLLERTIKHMVFMQSITKHADKLSNCAKSGGFSKETVASDYEQGSSWAVEVGSDLKICPIVVKNLNANGQMLIEMLCEDSDHFLGIAEAVKNLGLILLKGMTDNHGDKTWMRFVVENQSYRNVHRMDILWSLVQILQSKATA